MPELEEQLKEDRLEREAEETYQRNDSNYEQD